MNAKDILNYIDIQIKVFEAFGKIGKNDHAEGVVEGLNLVKQYITLMAGEHG